MCMIQDVVGEAVSVTCTYDHLAHQRVLHCMCPTEPAGTIERLRLPNEILANVIEDAAQDRV